MEFGDTSIIIDENAGEVEIEVTLDGPVECFTISVTVIVNPGTAESKMLILMSTTKVWLCIATHIAHV